MTSLLRPCAIPAMLAFALLVVPRQGAASPAIGTSTPAAQPVTEDTSTRVLPLTFEIEPSEGRELKSFTDLMVTVQEVEEDHATTLVGPVDPFTADNGCARPMPAGITACVINTETTTGTLRIEWRVPGPGTYTFVISAKRGTQERPEKLLTFHLDALAD
jgi:methionine-rich copper-binding protein CopC